MTIATSFCDTAGGKSCWLLPKLLRDCGFSHCNASERGQAFVLFADGRFAGDGGATGEPGWDRTIDHLIKSQVLYH
jgi:hypothetical protein